MNKYLIFRTDRIGDFLISAILIKCIKANDPNAHIITIGSNKNFSYIKKFSYVDEVIEFKNTFFDKINLILRLKKNIFKTIIIHDDKKRSKFISFFLKSNNKIVLTNANNFTHLEIIKNILKKLNFSFFDESLNIFADQKETKIEKSEQTQIHFDEKWVHSTYISKFLNIEPSKQELFIFINDLIKKTKNKLIITTGSDTPKVLTDILPKIAKINVKIYENLSFFELQNITAKSNVLIACHGAISHIAAANKIKQIDIIDKSYNYTRWTAHFRSYNYLYRDSFNVLSKKIINKL